MMLLHQIPPRIVLHVIFWLGKLAIEETIDNHKRTITFSPILRERLGHHIHGEIWATLRSLKTKSVVRPSHSCYQC
jgi:hypothetical protein